MDTNEAREIVKEAMVNRTMRPVEAMMLTMLAEMVDELRAIRAAYETEAVEDAEPDPFQTLNGPTS